MAFQEGSFPLQHVADKVPLDFLTEFLGQLLNVVATLWAHPDKLSLLLGLLCPDPLDAYLTAAC